MRFGNPVQGRRIVPFGQARTASDVLPDGKPAFRVTQRFFDTDAYYKDGRQHGAMDVGNYGCGALVLAMGPGVARRVQDNATALGAPSNARGVVIDHGGGWVTEYWHLNEWNIPNIRTPVAEGAVIGFVGSTGLGSVCHLHIECKYQGVKVDPWRRLRQVAIFDDVPESNPHKGAIEWAHSNGLLLGVGNDLFRPTEPLTREQAATVLERLYNLIKRENA